jgi:hypothetical protein
MWSLQLFTLLLPFHHIRNDTGVLLRVLGGERPRKPTECTHVGFSDALWDIMERGWHAEPGLRPTLAEFGSVLGEPSDVSFISGSRIITTDEHISDTVPIA